MAESSASENKVSVGRVSDGSNGGLRMLRIADEARLLLAACLCSLGRGRFRHYFRTVVAFIFDGVVGCGIGYRCRPVSRWIPGCR